MGAPLYCPADNESVVDKIINKEYEKIPLIIFCLEDSILEENLEQATISLKNKLEKLLEYQKSNYISILQDQDIKNTELEKLILKEFKQPKTGITASEYLDYILSESFVWGERGKIII